MFIYLNNTNTEARRHAQTHKHTHFPTFKHLFKTKETVSELNIWFVVCLLTCLCGHLSEVKRESLPLDLVISTFSVRKIFSKSLFYSTTRLPKGPCAYSLQVIRVVSDARGAGLLCVGENHV